MFWPRTGIASMVRRALGSGGGAPVRLWRSFIRQDSLGKKFGFCSGGTADEDCPAKSGIADRGRNFILTTMFNLR